VWQVERHDTTDLTVNVDHDPPSKLYTSSLRLFWPRLVATCMGWVANDFAFYGNKLFQSTFIALLYPEVSSTVVVTSLTAISISQVHPAIADATAHSQLYSRRMLALCKRFDTPLRHASIHLLMCAVPFVDFLVPRLLPQATEFERMQWSVLNSAISLTGYWTAACFVDKPWYGRVRMQNIGKANA
jgi:hypothetical protein